MATEEPVGRVKFKVEPEEGATSKVEPGAVASMPNQRQSDICGEAVTRNDVICGPEG